MSPNTEKLLSICEADMKIKRYLQVAYVYTNNRLNIHVAWHIAVVITNHMTVNPDVFEYMVIRNHSVAILFLMLAHT
jgi:hypothetical protein